MYIHFTPTLLAYIYIYPIKFCRGVFYIMYFVEANTRLLYNIVYNYTYMDTPDRPSRLFYKL